MKKFVFLSAALLMMLQIFAGRPCAPIWNVPDTLKPRDQMAQLLRNMKNGSLIVRLKTNQKSIDAYRRAGKELIAERIETERRNQNLKLYWAFRNYFTFCKVYFIYAHETQRFLDGERNVFLDKDLNVDPSITFDETEFIFCEYGSAQPFAGFQDYAPSDINKRERPEVLAGKESRESIIVRSGTETTISSGLVLTDKYLQQLGRPFPYVVSVPGENFKAPVKSLNRELERAYSRLVIQKDFREKYKKMNKARKEEWKSYQMKD